MFRTLLVAAALALSAPALACGDGADCGMANCKMKAQTEVDTAMAAVDAAEGTKVSFAVEGMHCGNCSDKVTAALKALEGVNAVAVSHAEGQAKVAFDPAKIDVDKLVATVNGAGFKATKAES